MFPMKPVMPWQRTVLPENSTIQDAIERMNETAAQIVIVASQDYVLKGTVTDGDIRRGLLAGVSLASPLAAILHQGALVASPQMSREDAIELMRANRIHQIPVVDSQRRLVGLYLLDDLIEPEAKNNCMVIMAGGARNPAASPYGDLPETAVDCRGETDIGAYTDKGPPRGVSTFYHCDSLSRGNDQGSFWGWISLGRPH